MQIVVKAIPEGVCDFCGCTAKDLDLLQDERKYACQKCSKKIQKSGRLTHILKTYTTEGYACIERVVKASGSSAHVYIPLEVDGIKTIGKRVKIIILDDD